jgi:hypothetical protein
MFQIKDLRIYSFWKTNTSNSQVDAALVKISDSVIEAEMKFQDHICRCNFKYLRYSNKISTDQNESTNNSFFVIINKIKEKNDHLPLLWYTLSNLSTKLPELRRSITSSRNGDGSS